MFVSSRTLLYCGTAVFLLLGTFFLLPPGGIWITDNGNKYIMMRNFAQGNGKLIPHTLPELFPTGGFHFIKVPQGAVSFYQPYLSYLSSFFYSASGERGALFIPLAATLLLLYLGWKYWNIPPPVLLAGTPLLFYSLILWEMTPSMFLVLLSLLLTEKKHYFPAGAVLSLSLLMREEAYFVCAALGGALLLTGRWRETVKFGTGFLTCLLPIWGYQWISDGHFLGLHGKYYYLNNDESFSIFNQSRLVFFNCFHHLFRFDSFGPSKLNYLAFAALLPLAAGAAPGFRKWKKLKYAALILYLCAMLFLAAGVWFQKETIYTASLLTGLFTATPLIAGVMINWRSFLKWKKRRLIMLFLLLYTVMVPPLMTASDIGLVWGARHFLVIMVPLVWLSFQGFRLFAGKKRALILFCGTLAVGTAIQIYGIAALYRVSQDSYAIEEQIRRTSPEVIVTDVFYLPEQMPRLFFEKTVVQVISKEDLKTLENHIKTHNIKAFTLLISPRFRQMNDAVLKELLAKFPLTGPPRRLTGKGGFPDLFVCQWGEK